MSEQGIAPAYIQRMRAFAERKRGDDTVQDIADVAARIRALHSGVDQSEWFDNLSGDRRIYWALMIDAAAQLVGMALDEYIERAREKVALILQPQENSSHVEG